MIIKWGSFEGSGGEGLEQYSISVALTFWAIWSPFPGRGSEWIEDRGGRGGMKNKRGNRGHFSAPVDHQDINVGRALTAKIFHFTVH